MFTSQGQVLNCSLKDDSCKLYIGSFVHKENIHTLYNRDETKTENK